MIEQEGTEETEFVGSTILCFLCFLCSLLLIILGWAMILGSSGNEVGKSVASKKVEFNLPQ